MSSPQATRSVRGTDSGSDGTRRSRWTARISAFRDRVRARPGGALGWRIGVTVLGVAIIAGGIVLLPLPGPGWLIIFAGLGLLATEYEWAARLLNFAKEQVKRWTRWLGEQPLWLRGLVGLVTSAVVVAIIVVVYEIYF